MYILWIHNSRVLSYTCLYSYAYILIYRSVCIYIVGIYIPLSEMESVYQYVLGELSRGYLVEEDEAMFSERQRRILTFMKTPRELEKVCCLRRHLKHACIAIKVHVHVCVHMWCRKRCACIFNIVQCKYSSI